MLNNIWCFFILVSIIYSFINGTFLSVNDSIFSSINSTKDLILTLFFNICFWSGIINIVKNTSFIDKIRKCLKPILKMIFPNISENSEIFNDISMNVVSNLLGLGNASTPSGIRAIEGMQKENNSKNKLSNEMLLFILINTSSIQIIPTNIIGIRMGLRF